MWSMEIKSLGINDIDKKELSKFYYYFGIIKEVLSRDLLEPLELEDTYNLSVNEKMYQLITNMDIHSNESVQLFQVSRDLSGGTMIGDLAKMEQKYLEYRTRKIEKQEFVDLLAVVKWNESNPLYIRFNAVYYESLVYLMDDENLRAYKMIVDWIIKYPFNEYRFKGDGNLDKMYSILDQLIKLVGGKPPIMNSKIYYPKDLEIKPLIKLSGYTAIHDWLFID